MKERQLNIELMRIVAMLLIFVWHIRIHYMPEAAIPLNTPTVTFLNYFCLFITFHVDLFVLITGYFGIRNWRKPIVKTLLLCVFYAIILNLLSWAAGERFNWEEIVMPVSHSPWWFMQVYLILVMIAPAIECFVSYSSNREFHVLLAVFLFLDVYLSFFWHVPNLSSRGYDIMNFLTVYLLGVWIRKNIEGRKNYNRYHWIPVVVFLICCLLRYKVQPIATLAWEDYNSPLALTMAVCVFYIFLHIKVPAWVQKPVLFLSSSAVSVYLVTDYPSFRRLILPLFSDNYMAMPNISYLQLLYLTAFVIVLFIACCIFDKIRILLLKPINIYLLNITEIRGKTK